MGSDDKFLAYGRQNISDADIGAVVDVLKSDFLTTGPAVAHLEDQLCYYTGAAHAVVCNSGTAALHLCLLAADVGPNDDGGGDVVIVPTVTFLSTANVVQMVGGQVVFADVNPMDGLMHLEDAVAAFEKAKAKGLNVKAVMPVHLNGQCADPAALYNWAQENKILVIEDAAHAIGSKYLANGGEYQIGSCHHADFTEFSFHPVKNITMGEGGAVMCANDQFAKRAALFRSHGMTRDNTNFQLVENVDNPWYYEMQEMGWNYRASDIQAALGASQLKRLDQFIQHRRRLVDFYDQSFIGFTPELMPLGKLPNQLPAWHLYPVLIDFDGIGQSRAQVMDALRNKGIGTQVHYIPVHQQPFYTDKYGVEILPGADAYYDRVLSLPLHTMMQEEDAAFVVQTLRQIITQK
jgi:UDP-4-amino-4,6-dideoxy-N-acetyl-beta-L-altrosamine transaminase